MYINKFSIVDFSPPTTLEQQNNLPKKRGRPPKNTPPTNKQMFIKSTETMPMQYQLTCKIVNQFKKDKRTRTNNCPSTTCSEESNSSSTSLVSSKVSSPPTHACVVPIENNTLNSSTYETNNSPKSPTRKIRYSISIRELLN